MSLINKKSDADGCISRDWCLAPVLDEGMGVGHWWNDTQGKTEVLAGKPVTVSLLQTHITLFCFLDRAFSIWKTKINQQNAQINSGLIYY